MHTIIPPNTDGFKQLEQYTTMRKEAYQDGEYANAWDKLFLGDGLPKDFLPWMRQNWDYLKYLYFKNLLTLDGIYATINFEQYCKEAYAVFTHNLYLEKFESSNIQDEINNLLGDVK